MVCRDAPESPRVGRQEMRAENVGVTFPELVLTCVRVSDRVSSDNDISPTSPEGKEVAWKIIRK